GQRENVLQDPAVLEAMSDLEAFMEKDSNIGGVTSIADHVKRMHQAMNGGGSAFYTVPDSQRLVGQYLLLYSMSAGPDALSAFVDAPYQRAVIRGLSKTDTAVFSRNFLDQVQQFAAE